MVEIPRHVEQSVLGVPRLDLGISIDERPHHIQRVVAVLCKETVPVGGELLIHVMRPGLAGDGRENRTAGAAEVRAATNGAAARAGRCSATSRQRARS